MVDAVLGCGSIAGRNTDKVAKFNIELAEVEESFIKIRAHSCIAIVCSPGITKRKITKCQYNENTMAFGVQTYCKSV